MNTNEIRREEKIECEVDCEKRGKEYTKNSMK